MSKIYESPDGGKTVYEREFRSSGPAGPRNLIKEPPFSWNEYIKGIDLDRLVETNRTVKEILERLKVIIMLCKE